MSSPSIDYLNSFCWMGSRLGLSRIRELMGRLGDPQDRLKFVHLAGTNGKGSTACFMSHILREAGYRTGLYTSPFIHTFHERMQVDGAAVSDEALDRIVARIREACASMEDHPTTFELVTAVALVWFAEMECDIVVLETGMGGGMDATNVISSHVLSIITPIDMDHMEFLGDTIAKIASQKAGIMKAGRPVVSARQRPEAETVLRAAAEVLRAPFEEVDLSLLSPISYDLHGQVFSFGDLQELRIQMLGQYQMENAALAIRASRKLCGLGFPIADEQIRRGLLEAVWPGRFELCGEEPAVIVDGGHNAQGALALAHNLARYFPAQKVVFVMGVLGDKDLPAIVSPILPLVKQVYTITPDNPRAMAASVLAEYLIAQGASAEAIGDVQAAIDRGRQTAGVDGVVCYFGSLYSVGDVRAALGLWPVDG